MTTVVCAEPELKVIIASMAATPPVIDGILDEECWQKTEMRNDITSVGEGRPLERETTMRFLYDEQNLYVGLELFWEDMEILMKGIAGINEKFGPVQENTIVDIRKYANIYGVEIFIDPGASGVLYYQILFNAAGQITGNMRMDWKNFNLKPFVRSTIIRNRWIAELVIPLEGLKTGDEMGLNLCRNDETYYGIWKQVGGSYHNPKLFGRLLLGNHRSWWETVWNRDTGMLENLTADRNFNLYRKYDPFFEPLVCLVKERMEEIEALALSNPPDNRADFEMLYLKYSEFRSLAQRLKIQYDTLKMVAETKKGRTR